MKIFGYNEKHEKKSKMCIPLSAYLSYLLIATLLITGVSFSKYATTGGTDDGARVAVVVMDGGSDATSTDLSLGDGVLSASYAFYVTNNASERVSEVPLSYTVFVTLPDGATLPDGVTVTLTYESGTADSPVSSEGGVYTFAGGADFEANVSAQHDYTLTFTVTDESLLTEDSSFTGVQISVKAEQID